MSRYSLFVLKLLLNPKQTNKHRLTLFGHIGRMDDNTDAKRILSTLPPEDWRRPRGRPHITWLSSEHHTAGSEIP